MGISKELRETMKLAARGSARIADVVARMPLLRHFAYRATKHQVFVRQSPFGDIKTVMQRGLFKLPLYHRIIPVNTRRTSIRLAWTGKDAPIARDGLPVEVAIKFHVQVSRNTKSIERAVEMLGYDTMDAAALKSRLHTVLDQALRTAVAALPSDLLEKNPHEFAQAIHRQSQPVIAQHGLLLDLLLRPVDAELEAVRRSFRVLE